jgi:GT2 family glycosyltransferase
LARIWKGDEVTLVPVDEEPLAYPGAAPCRGVWRLIEPQEAVLGQRWFRMRFSGSLFEPSLRPILRYETSEGRVFDHVMNGAFLGTGEFVGHVPEKAVRVWMNVPGASFRIDWILPYHWSKLAFDAFRKDRSWFFLGVGARLIDSRTESRQILKIAATATPVEKYDTWYRNLARPYEPTGLDAPPPASDLPITLIAPLAGPPEALARFHAGLSAAGHGRVALALVEDRKPAKALREAARALCAADPRVRLGAGAVADGLVARVDLSDALLPGALALLAAEADARPGAWVIHGDEDAEDASGVLHSPRFKPDWSPVFQAATGYLGRLAAIRTGALARARRAPEDLVRDEAGTLAAVLAGAGPAEVVHLRRLLYRRAMEREATPPAPPVYTPPPDPPTWPRVSVIIPTKNRLDLIWACCAGLNDVTDYPDLEVVIVDNGSDAPDALDFLAGLDKRPGYRVLRAPGPFNYSRLCNLGAAAATGEVLVFLNNDIAMDRRDWLKPLVRWATRPEVGAVSGKLLFSDRTMQHAGVVLGMGGIAGHPYRTRPETEPGYLDRVRVPNEQMAVTGACLVVTADKFRAIGGYDETNLPVELNDTDICLRLDARGWVTIWTPEAVLFHHESKSRGRKTNPFSVYAKERTYFRRRWADTVRDDRYHHPALSLFSRTVSLS